MNSSNEQPNRRPLRTGGRGEQTRQALLHAAAELIAELGWGRVTTRAVAEQADLPLGTVSYHFRGKHELLTEAALQTVEQMFPMSELEALETIRDLRPLVIAWVGDRDSMDPVLSGVLMEAMREAGRNTVVAQRLATILRDYRRVMADLVHAEQSRGAAPSGPAPSALATLIAAVGDGLLLHAMLDPDLDVVGATEALLALLGQEPGN